MFGSAAYAFGPNLIAVVLSGSGQNGCAGVPVVREHGGVVLAQDRETSAYFGMPAAAISTGAVNEVLPKDQLLDRAWELARELAKRPPLVLRYTRMLFTKELKRAFLNELGHGIARETYAQRQFFPVGGGMTPLDRPWNEEPWSKGRKE